MRVRVGVEAHGLCGGICVRGASTSQKYLGTLEGDGGAGDLRIFTSHPIYL
jgi:hypothetical protein